MHDALRLLREMVTERSIKPKRRTYAPLLSACARHATGLAAGTVEGGGGVPTAEPEGEGRPEGEAGGVDYLQDRAMHMLVRVCKTLAFPHV